MWKLFGRKKKRGPADEAIADLREKFRLETHGYHGFPLGPSCMSFDPYRRLLYIGTNSGDVRMVGAPGIKLSGALEDVGKINQILPFASEAAVITVCANNMMHKWCVEPPEVEGMAPQLVLDRSYKFQGGLAKTITVCCLPPHSDCLLVGTLGGITYPMDAQFEGMSPEVLSWSRARATLGYKGKDIPGEVRSLEINPKDPKQLLIAYEHGYFELWDALTWTPKLILGPFRDCGDTLSVAWNADGDQFVSSHQNGTIAYWNLDSPEGPTSIRTLHEGQCQDITRILWPRDNMLVMSGGAPLDKIDGDSVTVAENDDLCTLQLTSPVRGLHILEDLHADRDSGIVNSGPDNATSTSVRNILILLLEQEVLFVDLSSPEFPLVPPPYLFSAHSSPVKLMEIRSRVDREVWHAITQIGRVQRDSVYRSSAKSWPVNGGKMKTRPLERRDLLLTGHEDGTVKFWDISNPNMNLIYTVDCSLYFSSDSLDTDFFSEKATPTEPEPFNTKQLGFWDPRSDDDQLSVTSIDFQEELLAIGLHGGVALLFNLSSQSATVNIKLVRVSIMRDDPRQRSRNWQAPLTPRTGGVECDPGYQPSHCVHLFPNVSTTTLAVAKDQGLVAVGCVFGFTVVDFLKGEIIHIQSTYDSSGPDVTQMSRMQSIRRSFRQSLKRLNVRHSMRGTQSTQRSHRPSNFVRAGSARPSVAKSRRGGGAGTLAPPPKRDLIKTLTFTAPCHIAGHSATYNLLVGTNCGQLLTYTIDMPAPKHRQNRSPIVMPVEHNYNLKKDETVLFAGVIDAQSYLLDVNDEGSFHSARGTQYLTVVTEEGIKVVSLPNAKKKYKVHLKQNSEDEFHIVSAHYLRVAAQSTLLIMDSEGYISLYTLPDLRLVCREDCVDASDAVGQRHFVTSSVGVILHQSSPSEFIRDSVTEEGRLDINFTVPLKAVTPLKLTPTTPKHDLVDQLPTPLDIQMALKGTEREDSDDEDCHLSNSGHSNGVAMMPQTPLSPESLKEFQERAL